MFLGKNAVLSFCGRLGRRVIGCQHSGVKPGTRKNASADLLDDCSYHTNKGYLMLVRTIISATFKKVMSVFIQIISVSATLASLCMVASPIITVNNMRVAKSVGTMSITFFCAQFLNCNVWAMYGILTTAYPVIICNTIGCSIAAYCILTFLTTARLEEKSGHVLASTTYRGSLNATFLTTALIIGLMILLLCFVNLVSFAVAVKVNGILGGCCSVFMLSSPLGMAKTIIANRNAEPLQPVTVVFATLNSVLWTLYGLLKMDMFITIPNTLCTFACFFQIFLLVRYGRHRATPLIVSETLAPIPLD